MASSGAPIANAAVTYSTFNSLRLSWRLIRYWDSQNINKNGEFMGIKILLLGELDSVIHGFISANQASHYWNDLKTGSIVRLDWTVLKFYVRTHVQDHGASVHDLFHPFHAYW
ncbi:hypothetical protein Rs2_09639 [Raphanus sativus]|uniref:Uncharacterized protein LOC108846752 n=1 Tax=Raphanus sativus TaxID=3726 RepID=A0A6J0MSL3_RAPSA|nr:uncharacterized protein LOC108846752 [Raphanus sativus]KAJ4905981.1 hypothetical protein Rs2_09639 [Raphanus sativus]